MKIKKLELVGFKSFVDKTVLHFDHDVLGIVGPNGCGKSNIVDAIRWCMGEQSARHLRGRSMEDVLFAGSETRGGHDFAEVTLTFENNDPSEMPLELREYSEVAVTRRLHRSGDSEYLINKTQVRLRDVTDLFLGTGAGTKAYSIVEQGKVGLIVSAKPEDRRLLIEEAAGITRFKSRKKQAEKKMELTQQNLLRVGDIVAEIDRSLASLTRQAAKAERYVAYRNELEDLHLYEASHRYLELVGWIGLESGEVARLGEAHEQGRAELHSREAGLEVGRLEVLGAEGQLETAQSAAFAADSAVRAEEAAIGRAEERLGSLSRREQQAQTERQAMTEQASRLAEERESVAVEATTLSEEEGAHADRAATEDAALEELSGVQAAANGRVAELRQAIAATDAQIASGEAKLAGFERRRADISARLEKVRTEGESLELARIEHAARAEEVGRSIEDLREGRVTSAAEKTRLEERLGELKACIVGQERSLEDAKADLSRARSRLHALEEMQARLEGVGAGVKALVERRDACVAGLVADHLEAPAELTLALAGALGARLQDVVVRDVEAGMGLLESLAVGRKGRATIVPWIAPFVAGSLGPLPVGEGVVGRLADTLRYAPEDEALVQSLVGDVVVVRDRAAAEELRAAGVRARLVTLDGMVLRPDGSVSGGQGDPLAAGMIDGKREARELGEATARFDALVTARLEALQASRAEMAQVGAALDRARHEAHSRELALVTAEKDLQKSEAQLEGITRRQQVLATEGEELTHAATEAAFERDEADRGLGEARERVEIARGELGVAEGELEAARRSVDEQRQVVTAGKVALAGLRERLSAARGTEARLARSAAELDDRAGRLEVELVGNAHDFAETAAQLEGHRTELQAALDRARDAQDALGRVRQDFETLRAALLEKETALRDLRSETEGFRDALSKHEMALRERQLSFEHLMTGVAEKFRGLRLDRVVGDYHLRPPPDETLRARIEDLTRLLERMGSVNLDAMREHAEAEQRFTFYTAQKADLDKALADLTRAIQQMNRESRRLFQETFDAINERFREIFPRMFRGGRAELRMTNPEDLLETGIDIVAQPPGKKLSSIELMSGGEKALTAVSLVFAIFQIKPSPFCILDEVDAPLDEANVARYNEVVRSMTDRSQFILITHVKRTMQTVDVLYGVTMPEPGVSKIVSVKMNEAARQPARAPAQAQAAVA